jgi:hypothetical protein
MPGKYLLKCCDATCGGDSDGEQGDVSDMPVQGRALLMKCQRAHARRREEKRAHHEKCKKVLRKKESGRRVSEKFL